jgi:phage I-like protein/cation transport regulator ChaB
MPYNSIKDLSENTKRLPAKAKEIWLAAFNSDYSKNKNEESAIKIAWSAVGNAGYKKENDQWIKADELELIHYFTKLSLSETNSDIEIMRTGSWSHPKYGDFQITEDNLNGFIKSFDENVRGIQIAIDLEHGETSHKGAAIGWIKSLKKDNKRLLAEIEWTNFGKDMVQSKQYKYFSPEFVFQYTDLESNKKFNNVLMGGSLTNKPFIKNMAPVLLSEEVYKETLTGIAPFKSDKEESVMKFNENILKALKLDENATEDQVNEAINKQLVDLKKLSEDNEDLIENSKKIKKENDELTKKLSESENKKNDLDQTNIKLSERILKVENKLNEKDWEILAERKLSEGVMTPAMAEKFKAAYLKDKEGTIALMETLQPVVNMGENGSSRGDNEVSGTGAGDKFNAAVIKCMETNKLEYDKAMEKVTRETPELFEAYRNERRGL